MSRITLSLGLLAVLGLAALGWRSLQPDAPAPVALPDETRTHASLTTHNRSVPEASFGAALAHAQTLREAPDSLTGTQVDGQLQVTEQGELVISPDLRLVFDYFLSTQGEESLADCQARLARYLNETLPPLAADNAWQLFQQYLALGEAMIALPPHDGSPEGIREAVRQRHAMQQAYLGPEAADAFYGLDMAYDRYMADRQAILDDPTLDQVAQQQRLMQLSQSLPQEMQSMMQDTQAPVRLAEKTEVLREQGASEAEIRVLREQHFGAAAADRMEALDAARAEWDSRYQVYRTQRQSILDSGLAEQDQEAELARLQQQLFSGQELPRVQALDRIEQH
ncbi:lipase chaperone [Alcanivorax nanhaiticus]|uniref:Lipase chaperone n=1 Tax=Alcanivorax nanhaiticus TaxID=1177154 RepID=A0A095SPK3_9GAMM|nr:lipase secretion chaperone [Alcanivorax nanhaiticus]KGD66571.1 lipase chaperone [Alcanivorax nanhaiticus]